MTISKEQIEAALKDVKNTNDSFHAWMLFRLHSETIRTVLQDRLNSVQEADPVIVKGEVQADSVGRTGGANPPTEAIQSKALAALESAEVLYSQGCAHCNDNPEEIEEAYNKVRAVLHERLDGFKVDNNGYKYSPPYHVNGFTIEGERSKPNRPSEALAALEEENDMALQWLDKIIDNPDIPRSVIRTIRTALQRNDVPQWQPIDTAPKDGTSILCFDKFSKAKRPPIYVSHYYQNPVTKYGCWTGGKPTHWMPLPAAPKPTGE